MKHLLVASLVPLLIACNGNSEPGASAPDAPSAASETTLPNVADQLIDDGKTLGEMLAQVNSVEAAEDIRPTIEAMVSEYSVLIERIDTMESPSFSDMAALASRAKPLAETQQRVATEIQRIYADHPEAADVLREALGDLGRP